MEIGSHLVAVSKDVKNLGVYFDSTLSMKRQINCVSSSMLYHLRNISSIRRLLTQEATAMLIHSLVTSRLDYCNILYHGIPDKQLNKLQRVQNVAARILTCTKKFDHITPVLKSLHWLPVKARVEYKLLLTTYKAVNGLSPQYISTLLQEYVPVPSLRSKDKGLLVVPDFRLDSFGRRSFQYAGPRNWRDLPPTLRTKQSLNSFKEQLKSHLFKKHF